jgi:Ni/Co efflux regulator RcnB
MGRNRTNRTRVAALVAVLAAGLAAPATRLAAQAKDASAEKAPYKSVYGKLVNVDDTHNTVLMAEDGGGQLAWRFDKAVIAEAAKFKPGDPVIVIYRQTSPKQKRVTALAFPGTAKSPIYVNMTGDRVVIRSAAAVNGSCDAPDAKVSESVIPARGLAEVMDACWCCAPVGGSCSPTTKSGNGRALLSQCFQ